MPPSNKNGNYETMKKIAAIALFLPAMCFWTQTANAAAAFTNIEVCTQPPDPITTNLSGPGSPDSPIIRYETRRNNFYYYRIQISRQSDFFTPLAYDTGDKAYESTFSYGGQYCGVVDIWGRPNCSMTIVSGHPTPRCPCDSSESSAECNTNGFGASAGDPDVCYDWWTEPATYSCSWDSGGSGIFSCFCSAGGTCGTITCSSPWDPFNPGCSCTDGTTCPSGFYCYDDGYGGYSCSCSSYPCISSKSNQFTKVENPVAKPAGTYPFTVPAGTLSIGPNGTTYYYQVKVKDAYDWTPYVSGSFFLVRPVNGVCGTVNNGVSCDSAGDGGGTLCAQGDVINMTAVNCGWYWTCQGRGGGTNSPICKSYRAVPLGSCGTIPF